jgi:type III pantothenate kinase
MEINVLALNLGNSRLAMGAFVAGELKHVTRLPHERRDDWPAAIEQVWAELRGRESAAVAGASVNPPMLEALEHAVHQATGQDVQWVGREIDLPIKVLTESPRETGVDRILNVAAAYEQMEKACVVVDAGTAVTVDVCNDSGDFLGGAIAAGASLQLEALHTHTANLPKVNFEVPAGPFGKNTKQATLEGVYHGIRGLVKELTENYATELGFWPDIIATGGDALKLFEGWELIHAIAPDLTLYGIALAYANHHIKHGT